MTPSHRKRVRTTSRVYGGNWGHFFGEGARLENDREEEFRKMGIKGIDDPVLNKDGLLNSW